MKNHRSIFISVVTYAFFATNITLCSMKQQPQEELQISTEQIKHELAKTNTLPQATAKYFDLHKRISTIFPSYLEDERQEMLEELETIYTAHLVHTKLEIKKDQFYISGLEIINKYKALFLDLDHIVKNKNNKNSELSLPNIFTKNLFASSDQTLPLTIPMQIEILQRTKKYLAKVAPYHQLIASGSAFKVLLNKRRNDVILAYKTAIKKSSLFIDQWTSDEQPTCPYQLTLMLNAVPPYEQQLRELAEQHLRDLQKYQTDKEKLAITYKTKQSKRASLEEKLDKAWNASDSAYTKKCISIIMDNYTDVLTQLHNIKQLAQAIQLPAQDGGIVNLKIKDSKNNRSRIESLTSNLLAFAYPYMTHNEIQSALTIPYQPTNFSREGFINEQACKINKQECTIYLNIRNLAMKEVFKALDAVKKNTENNSLIITYKE